MNRKNEIVCAVGLAMGASLCGAQSSDELLGLERQLAADVARNASSLAQSDPAVKISGQVQFRFVSNARDDVPGGGEDNASGFQTRRAKLKFSGKLADQWSYKVTGAFSKSSGSIKLEDAYAEYKTVGGIKIRGGQFKMPYMREELVSSSKQLAADRSIANEFFNQGFSQGVQVSGSADKFRWAVSFNDGLNTANTDFTSSKEADYGFTGRVEYLFSGDNWDRFKDFTSWQDSDFAGMIGGAVHYQSGGETFATVDAEVVGVTADVSVEGNGWNAFVSGNFQNVEPAGGSDVENSGFVVQGGYVISPSWEIFGRYDMLFSDQNDDFSTVTAGVNRFFIPESHAAKFTADVQFFLDEQSASDALASTSTGLLPSGSDSQVALRLQMQLLF